MILILLGLIFKTVDFFWLGSWVENCNVQEESSSLGGETGGVSRVN